MFIHSGSHTGASESSENPLYTCSPRSCLSFMGLFLVEQSGIGAKMRREEHSNQKRKNKSRNE